MSVALESSVRKSSPRLPSRRSAERDVSVAVERASDPDVRVTLRDLAVAERWTNVCVVGAVLERAISIRSKTSEDAAFIEQLSAQAFGDFQHHAAAATLRLTERPGSTTRLAVRGDERLGFVVVERERDGAWISAIAVTPSERGRGIGARLMAEAARLARGSGAARLRLTTAQANVEALELFLKCGFSIDRRIPRYYARGQDACVLTRAL